MIIDNQFYIKIKHLLEINNSLIIIKIKDFIDEQKTNLNIVR